MVTVLGNVADMQGTDGEFSYRKPWQVGDEIVIAATGFEPLEAEVRTITAISVSGANTALTLDSALEYQHIGECSLLFYYYNS